MPEQRYNNNNWEESDAPILCGTCLGDNPYLKMLKSKYSKACHICERPFTSFRWRPGKQAREKQTIICQMCSKVKNACQTCIFDLEYNLPIQVRDKLLNLPQDDMPKSEVGRAFQLQRIENQMQNGGVVSLSAAGNAPRNEVLEKLARKNPYYERNLPKICTFWIRSACNRGETCPYRHTKPRDPDDPLNDQNIKDRYYGVNDPVAEKIMKRYEKMINDEEGDEPKHKSMDPQSHDHDSQVPSHSPSMLLPPPPTLLPPPGAKGEKRKYASQDPDRYGGDLKRARK